MTGNVNCPLIANLRELQLVSAAQLQEISRSPLATNPDPKPLAAALVKQGWLTPYQVNQLLQGRGKELVLGPFRLLDRLGESSLGKVFKALQLTANRIVAIQVIPKEKFPTPDATARFYAQIQAIQQINHPHLLVTFGVAPLNDAHAVILELPEGCDLGQHIQRIGPLPVAVACKYIYQAALGLQAVHERGMVHRCIRPASLFLAQTSGTPSASAMDAAQGTIKLLDLGLGTLVQPSAEFLAPEQASNPTGADIRSDLYSLGCTFYFLLAGRPPFQGNSASQLLQKQQHETPPLLTQFRRDIPPAILGIIGKLLAKRPQDRFQSPAELATALGAAGSLPKVPPAPIMPAPALGATGQVAAWLGTAKPLDDNAARTRRSRRWVVPAIATGLLVIVAGAVAGALLYPDIISFRSKSTIVEQTNPDMALLPPVTVKEPKEEPKAEPKEEPKPKAEPKEEPKPKAEPKEEPKPKAEPKEEPKPKAEPKTEPKDDLPDDIPALTKQLKDKDEAVRLRAAKRLEKLGTAAKDAIPALTDALKDPDEDVRVVAQRALDILNKTLQKEEVAALVKQLKDKDETIRLQAAKKLGQLGAAALDAVPALTEALKDSDADVRAVAKKSLDTIQIAAKGGNPALVEISKGLKSKQQAERVKAAVALAKLGGEGKELSAALIESMMERWPTNKEEFLDALEKINPAIHKPILTLLLDQESRPRMEALESIEKLGAEGRPALPVLTLLFQAGLQERGKFTQLMYLGGRALVVMARVAPQEKVVIQAVVNQIPSGQTLSDGFRNRATAIQLGLEMKIEPRIIVPALITALGNQQARLSAIEALKQIGPDAKGAIPALSQLRFDSNQEIRDATMEALKKIQEK